MLPYIKPGFIGPMCLGMLALPIDPDAVHVFAHPIGCVGTSTQTNLKTILKADVVVTETETGA